MKRLIENLTSGYIEAMNGLRPKNAQQMIVAYVESYDDISFWRTLFDKYEGRNYHFKVMLPSRSSLTKGKKTAMMNQLGESLGKNMIACVDSDYDWLMQGTTETSRQMINSPYILHTYAYAIENFKCYAQSMHQLCVQCTQNDRLIIDFTEYMKFYSRISFPLFMWDIFFYRERKSNLMPMMDFCNIVRLDSIDLSRPERALELLQLRVNKKIHYFERMFPDYVPKVLQLRTELSRLDVLPENAYFYIQGHHIMDNVAVRILTPVCNRLRREREQEIKKLALHNRHYNNELAAYKHSQCDITFMLRKNTNYEDAPPYLKLKKDVEKFLDSLQITTFVG